MGARTKETVVSAPPDTCVNGHGANGNGHKDGIVLLRPSEKTRRQPIRKLPEGMHTVEDVSPHSLRERLLHIGARRIPAEANVPERYSFYDGTHFEFGSQGPVFIMEGFVPNERPQRFDLQETAVRETLNYTAEKVTSQLEFIFPFDELLQGHAGVRVLTITPHSRGIRHVSVRDYASLPDREREIVDVGRILHNQQNIRRNRGERRHIR